MRHLYAGERVSGGACVLHVRNKIMLELIITKTSHEHHGLIRINIALSRPRSLPFLHDDERVCVCGWLAG
jgi:hypothetical protein